MRLTLWFVGAFSVVLIVFSLGVYFFVERILRERLDTNLRFTLEMTSSALARHTGDQRLLRQMISNLLDNAIKFTPQGGTVEVGLHQVNSSYQITVADTGCGISAELRPRIFERFFRADKARLGTGGLGGAGLGLAIARSIAELHHGRLSLQHCGAEGSIFCISLPFREDGKRPNPA
jgi:signal transduction histidine kinase